MRIFRKLAQMLDVEISNPQDEERLLYDAGTGKWVNGTPAGASGAPDDATYLVTTAHADLSAEVPVGTSPGGELGGTWASPTVDTTHSGSSHASVQAAAEATAAAALSSHASDTTGIHGITDTSNLALITGVPSNATFNDHSARHEDGGADEISLAGLSGTPAALQDFLDENYVEFTATFEIAASGDDGVVGAVDTVYPPATTPSVNTTRTTGSTYKAKVGADYYLDVTCLRWDTSSLPDDAVVTAATLRMYVTGKTSADSRSITADWYDWGASVDTSDWTSTPGTNAHAGSSITGVIGTSQDNDFALLNPESHVNLSGYTYLRLHTSGGAPTGENYADTVSYDHLTLDGPRLLVTYRVPAATGLTAHIPDTTNVHGITDTSALALTANVVTKALYDANTVLAANSDDTPAAVTMGASTILARLAAGNIKAATPAELRTLLDVPTNAEAVLDTLVDAKGDLLVGSAADTVARLAVGATNGQVLEVASGASNGVQWDLPAGHEFDYVQFTSNVTISATTEGTANTIVTSNSVTFDGSTTVLIEFWCPNATTGTNGSITFAIYESSGGGAAASIALGPFVGIGSGVLNSNVSIRYRITPTAAAKVYSIRAYRATANGTIFVGAGGAGAQQPGFIRITKV